MKLLFALILLATNFASAKESKSLNGLDTFGSKRLTAQSIQKDYGAKISQFFLAEGDTEKSLQLQQSIEAEIKARYKFSFVNLSLVIYFKPSSGKYLTIDVVEPEDESKRMTFLPSPKGEFKDPDGLIALWEQYLNLSFELQRAGQFEYPKNCPAWHCTHGFENPKLAPYLEKFNSVVPANEAKLEVILKNDKRAHFRANAAFLLAHIKSGQKLVQYLLPQIQDSSDLVRNNSMRVLSEIAMRHPDMAIPVEPIIGALHYPTTTDRNKAAYILLYLSKKEMNKPKIVQGAGEVLIEMLKLQQPNNHDPAFEILKSLSGKNFGARDYAAWEKWMTAQIKK